MTYFGHYPSIELQALAFIEQARSSGSEEQSIDTEWNGFAVELVYAPDFEIDGRQIGRTLAIMDVSIPPNYQCRKWLLRYCQFCTLLAGDAVVVFAVDDWMEAILSGEGSSFERIGTRTWLLESQSEDSSLCTVD